MATATIRAVAQGVIGVALIQSLLVGLCLLMAGVPWAGVLAIVVLVLGIAQVPALLVTLPAIGYIWWSGDYGNVKAIIYSALIFVSGMADNVLKPLLLGRGVEAPMPVILLGALGGMAARGHPGNVRRCNPAGAGLPSCSWDGWSRAASRKSRGGSERNRRDCGGPTAARARRRRSSQDFSLLVPHRALPASP